ncbi:MAG: rod shape-determining protein RodA [Sedimentisphaerales bacterium]|nr:rod shape-determining protein RodA [Sedimentisphaerales bacterium]
MLKEIWQGRLGGLRLVLLLAVLALVGIGLANIYAATADNPKLQNAPQKQLVWLGLCAVGFVAVNLVHYRHIARWSYGLYVISLLGLVLVLAGKYLGIGSLVPSVNGAYRWVALGPLRVQPSEIAKLASILALAWYLRARDDYREFKGLVRPFLLMLVPMGLIVLEPDLGTTLLFLPVLFAMLFVAGAKVKHLLVIIFLGLLLAPLMYFKLEPYQRQRIDVLLNQESENPYWLRGPGFQLHESKIWIGSGGLTGQGWRQGAVVRYRYLPHHHNDLIFSLIAHQWGFVGAVGVLALFVVIMVGGVEIAANQTEATGRLIAIGVTSLLGAQMFINVGVAVGLMPTTGMTLPFVSYGGSSLLANFLALGLLINVARHRPRQLARDQFNFDE